MCIKECVMGIRKALRTIRNKVTGTSAVLANQEYMKGKIQQVLQQIKFLDLKLTVLGSVDSPEYADDIKYIKTHRSLGVFNGDYADKYVRRFEIAGGDIPVAFDEVHKMCYVMHNGKRLYFPVGYNEKSASALYESEMMEQDEHSPHLYIDSSIDSYRDGVVVEIGAQDGSFSLDMVDRAKEVYVFECVDEWIEALKVTFAPYKNVHIVKSLVSDKDEGEYCTLDTVLRDVASEVTVIKADVEGWEPAALRGAKNILQSSKHIMLLVCAYHNQGDEDEIRQILGNAFKVEPREGHMLFIWDDNLSYPFFRHGVLKCTKR